MIVEILYRRGTCKGTEAVTTVYCITSLKTDFLRFSDTAFSLLKIGVMLTTHSSR